MDNSAFVNTINEVVKNVGAVIPNFGKPVFPPVEVVASNFAAVAIIMGAASSMELQDQVVGSEMLDLWHALL